MSDDPSSTTFPNLLGGDPFGLGVLSGGQSAGIVQSASSAGIAPQQAPSDSSSPLGTISNDLANIVNSLKQGNQIKGQATDALGQFEQLVGIGPAPVAAPDQSQSVLTIVAVVALLVLGGAVVWKLMHRKG